MIGMRFEPIRSVRWKRQDFVSDSTTERSMADILRTGPFTSIASPRLRLGALRKGLHL